MYVNYFLVIRNKLSLNLCMIDELRCKARINQNFSYKIMNAK